MSSTVCKETEAVSSRQIEFNWKVIILLFLLLAIPGIPAAFIVASVVIGIGTQVLPFDFVNVMYLSQPWAVIVHGMSGFLFFLGTPLQFSPAFRHKFKVWHKRAGYVVFVAGITMALSGIWMHHVLTPTDLGARYVNLVIMSLAMCGCFIVAVKHIIQKRVFAHQVWMVRAIAVTLGAITYVFIETVFALTIGQISGLQVLVNEFLHDYGRILAVVGNLVVAEWMLRKRMFT